MVLCGLQERASESGNPSFSHARAVTPQEQLGVGPRDSPGPLRSALWYANACPLKVILVRAVFCAPVLDDCRGLKKNAGVDNGLKWPIA